MEKHNVEAQVREGLSESEPIDQGEFVERFSEDTDIEEGNVLYALRTLMERDKVSYTIDYDLQIEE